MSRRRLVLPAGLVLGLDPLHGLSEPRRIPAAAPVRRPSAKTAGTEPHPAPNRRRPVGSRQPEAGQPPASRSSRRAAADFARVVHDNGRRSRFATPGGAKRGRVDPRPDRPGRSGRPSRRAWPRSSRGAISGRWATAS